METRERPSAETGGSGAAEGRKGVGEAPIEAPGGAPADVEAAARVPVDGEAWVASPASRAAGAGNEGLILPTLPAAGASGERPRPSPGGVVLGRPHHKASFVAGESFRAEMDEGAGELVRRGGAEMCVVIVEGAGKRDETRASCEVRRGKTVVADGDATVETPPSGGHFRVHGATGRERVNRMDRMRFCQRCQRAPSVAKACFSTCEAF